MKTAYSLLAGALLILAACNSNTKPGNLANTAASLPASFNFSKMGLKVIASSINTKKNTMATLYGNEAALKKLSGGEDSSTTNQTLALVTWQQKADDHWFGANIPANLQSVEVVKMLANKTITYQKYTGKNLTPDADTTGKSARVAFILHTRPSVMP